VAKPAYPGNDIKGWMSPKELQWLYEQARNMDSIVEIGCWHGRSTHALLSGCRGTVYAVDHWQGSPGANGQLLFACRDVKTMDVFAAFMKNVGEFANLQPIKMASLEAVGSFADKSVDMVFIDGSHLYEAVKADILAWLPKARKLISGHDYGHKVWGPGVAQALEAIFGNDYEVGPGGIWFKWLEEAHE